MAVYIGLNSLSTAGFGPSNLNSMYLGTTKLWPSVQERSGSYVAMGQFSNFNSNYATPRIQFFENNLSASTGLKSGSGFDSIVFSGFMNPDNTFFAGGSFTTYDGTGSAGMIKIGPDGAMVKSFNVGTGPGTGGSIYAMMTTPEGQVYIGGTFSSWSGSGAYDNGTPVKSFARLNANGTLDTTFQPASGGYMAGNLLSFATQSDGKILIGLSGTRFYYEGGNSYNVGGLFRLNPDHTLDKTFYTGSGDLPYGEAGIYGNGVYDVKVLPDGKILAAGQFSKVYGDTTYKDIVRLNSDGTLDTSFSCSLVLPNGGYYRRIIVEPSGSAYSYFVSTTDYQMRYNGTTYRSGYIIRLYSDGTPDVTYGTPSGFLGSSPEWMEDLGNTILYGGGDWFSSSVNYGKIVKIDKYSSPMRALTPPLVGNGLDAIVRVSLKFYS